MLCKISKLEHFTDLEALVIILGQLQGRKTHSN